MSADVDELLDIHQQMITMIRTYGVDVEEICDAWETRLYAWHDAFLEITAEVQVQYQQTGDPKMELSKSQFENFQDIAALKEEITEYGNAIFDAIKRDREEG